MHRASWNRERGSALIEAVVIGSFVFVVVLAGVTAAIDVAVLGGSAQDAARVGAVHAARHGGPRSAEELAGSGAEAHRVDGVIGVVVVPTIIVPHPDGMRRIGIAPGAEMPLAPFRSDRG